ncbi:uncharacterized protein LOC141903153 [Tubulanus polymorphus]|uniref:uncharacterized protein LOC141903153 n=1 Tax=Tubulanus polymorphus TaxID=672921 RepID=UPI003DA4A53A
MEITRRVTRTRASERLKLIQNAEDSNANTDDASTELEKERTDVTVVKMSTITKKTRSRKIKEPPPLAPVEQGDDVPKLEVKSVPEKPEESQPQVMSRRKEKKPQTEEMGESCLDLLQDEYTTLTIDVVNKPVTRQPRKRRGKEPATVVEPGEEVTEESGEITKPKKAKKKEKVTKKGDKEKENQPEKQIEELIEEQQNESEKLIEEKGEILMNSNFGNMKITDESVDLQDESTSVVDKPVTRQLRKKKGKEPATVVETDEEEITIPKKTKKKDKVTKKQSEEKKIQPEKLVEEQSEKLIEEQQNEESEKLINSNFGDKKIEIMTDESKDLQDDSTSAVDKPPVTRQPRNRKGKEPKILEPDEEEIAEESGEITKPKKTKKKEKVTKKQSEGKKNQSKKLIEEQSEKLIEEQQTEESGKLMNSNCIDIKIESMDLQGESTSIVNKPVTRQPRKRNLGKEPAVVEPDEQEITEESDEMSKHIKTKKIEKFTKKGTKERRNQPEKQIMIEELSEKLLEEQQDGQSEKPINSNCGDIKIEIMTDESMDLQDDSTSVVDRPPVTRQPRKRKGKEPTMAVESDEEITEEPGEITKPMKTEKITKKGSKERDNLPEKLMEQSEKVIEEQSEELMATGCTDVKIVTRSDMFIGAHVSASKSIVNAVENAATIGARAFALFLRSQRRWLAKPLDPKVAEKFKIACQEHGYKPSFILPHGPYILNCGAPNEEILAKSRTLLLEELERCEMLGLTLYNLHPGSSCGEISTEECINKIASSINLALEKTSTVTVVLENMSCQGNTIGGRFTELKQIIDRITDKSRIGVCLDTCHAMAAGYDLSQESGFKQMMHDFETTVGFKYLKALHLNDSVGICGCHRDLHENIGRGKIGLKGFERVVNDHTFTNIPMILETPANVDDITEIKKLYNLIKE